ncbi:MAG: hypothetical protein U9Q40_08210 [Campylobacterota bacterium]|nr:hypothetical protein [Campylobacterota bacterium]
MKTFLIILTFLLAFSACSEKTAFSRFDMSKKQELGADSLQRSKLKFQDKVNGIVSIIYLNTVAPELYSDDEYFYVNSYVKNRDDKPKMLLNNQEPLSIKELSAVNEFTELMNVSTEWSKYYLVAFPKQGDKLSFVFESGQYVSDSLKFEKDE